MPRVLQRMLDFVSRCCKLDAGVLRAGPSRMIESVRITPEVFVHRTPGLSRTCFPILSSSRLIH